MITGVKSISAGLRHSLVLFNDNTITGFGDDSYGQIKYLFNVNKISAGYNHNLVLLINEKVTGFGHRDYNQINIPINTSGIEIAAGHAHSLIILNDKNITGFGDNSYGEITIPNGIVNNAIKISAGFRHSLALLEDGRVTGWGYNNSGQINIPVGIGTNATGISAGAYFSLALLKDGRVTGWGDNRYGQINIPIGIGTNATGISAGTYHSLALLKNGTITGWGKNTYGQINIPTSINTNASGISAGGDFSVALLKNGTITGWGENTYGQISFTNFESYYVDQSKFEFSTGLFLLNGIQTSSKKLKPVFDTGIYNYTTGQININQYIQKYINLPVNETAYTKLVGYNILSDISFIPIKKYLGQIYTGLFSGKEPYEYDTGLYGLPEVSGEIISNQYINYKAKTYRQNPIDPYYKKFMPYSGEQHILLLDMNLYGFEEDSIEDCDIELNSLILKTGYFKDIPKNPTILNIEILDRVKLIGVTDNINDITSQKRTLQNFNVNNFINYDSSYYDNQSSSIDVKYKFLKNKIIINPPLLSNNRNISLPCLFQYTTINNNLSYDLGEYKFLVFDEANVYLQSGNYITGAQTGFLYFLKPGTYTTILSGNENDFLYTENNNLLKSGKNQNINLLSLNVNYVTGEKLQEIYIENQDKIWATYQLAPKEIFPGSGLNYLNRQDPVAFTIDFERSISGTIESPFLFYKEVSGLYSNLCTPTITVLDGGIAECQTSFCLMCQQAFGAARQGSTYIDVPSKSLQANFIDLLNFYDPPDQNTYRIALDAEFNALCCYCKEKGCGGDIASQTITKLNFASSKANGAEATGNAIYSGVFFLDDINPLAVKLKYNINYYSGQIAVNSFNEGDKITFKQYPFDYEKVFLSLYGVRPAIKEYTTEFVYSTTTTGYNYFNDKDDLINKINLKLASSGLYVWKPLKYEKNPQYEYAPLLTGVDGGINASGDDLINIISLRSGRFGAHDIKLNLQPRLQIYNYLVPKIIRLEVSDNYIDWTGVAVSENRQPINTYIKNQNAIPSNIPYDSIENTKYNITKEIPISSEKEFRPYKKEEDLKALLDRLASGNISGSGTLTCVSNPSGSGIVCGTGFVDYYINSFTCKVKGEGGETGKDSSSSSSDSSGKSSDSLTLKQEIDRFRIGYYDYLS
jgi:hypothetical protein